MDEKERVLYEKLLCAYQKEAITASNNFGRLLGMIDALIFGAELSQHLNAMDAEAFLNKLKEIQKEAGAWSHEA